MKSISTGVWLYCPQQFNSTSLPEDLRRYTIQATYLLHVVINEGRKQDNPQGWARVSSQILQKFIHPSIYTNLRAALEDAGFIEVHHSYATGKECKKYRLCKPHSTQAIIRVEVKNKALAKKMLQARLQRHGQPIKPEEMDPIERHLRAWQERVDINLNACLDTINDIEGNDFSRSYNTACVQDIASKEWEFSVCLYGRVHTNFTRLLSKCRKHLSIDGKPLVNIDIRNSQMVFLAIYIMDKHLQTMNDTTAFPVTKLCNSVNEVSELMNDSEHNAVNHDNENALISENTNQDKERGYPACSRQADQSDSGHQQYPEPTPICTTNPSQIYPINSIQHKYQLSIEGLNSDIVNFLSMCFDGTLYDYLIKQVGWQESRSKFKQEVFRHIFFGRSRKKWPYGKYDFICPSHVRITFIDLFPSVWEFICNEKQGDHSNLPKQMQERESNFVIRVVCQRLMERDPNIPIVTIHDSIMTTPEHVATVKQMILNEFSYMGVKAQVRVEND